jgi:prepilin-type N-terminal cleavage/methylation domain-containing protein
VNCGCTRRPACRHTDDEDTGFTLIELLIVIVIFGVLAAVVILAVGSATGESQTSACAADRHTIVTAVEAYHAQHAAAPAALTDLSSGNQYLRDDGSISATQKTGDGYTLTYSPADGSLSDCATALAAGGSAPTPAPTTTPTTATAVAAAVAVGPTTSSGIGVDRVWAVTMTITVTDDLGHAMAGASVSGSWGFSYSGNPFYRGTGTSQTTCTSNSSGICTLATTAMQSGVGGATLTLTAVAKSGLTWTHPTAVTASASRPF